MIIHHTVQNENKLKLFLFNKTVQIKHNVAEATIFATLGLPKNDGSGHRKIFRELALFRTTSRMR